MHSKETEKLILEAATEVFLEKGKEGTRMQDIADRADINKSSLHYYFRTKDNLYKRVLKNIIIRFFDFFTEEDKGDKDFRELLRHFISNYIERISQDPRLLRFIIWEVHQEHGQTMIEALKEKKFGGETFRDIIVDRIEQAVEAGEIKPIEPIHLLSSVVGLCAFPFFAKPILETAFEGTNINSEDFVEERKRLVFGLIWQYIGKED